MEATAAIAGIFAWAKSMVFSLIIELELPVEHRPAVGGDVAVVDLRRVDDHRVPVAGGDHLEVVADGGGGVGPAAPAPAAGSGVGRTGPAGVGVDVLGVVRAVLDHAVDDDPVAVLVAGADVDRVVLGALQPAVAAVEAG